MSITKSYNKHTNTYYAYDTTYIWNEDKQKKVQKKVCIGHYDKEGNISKCLTRTSIAECSFQHKGSGSYRTSAPFIRHGKNQSSRDGYPV